MCFCVKAGLVALMAVLAASCRPTGDFGRYENSFFYDTAVPATRNVVGRATGYGGSDYDLTRDEELMRARRRTLVELSGPSLERDVDHVGAELGLDDRDYQREQRVAHSTGLAELTAHDRVRTPQQMLSAIALDLEMLDDFEAVTLRVYEADKSRLRSLRENDDVPADDVVNTTARITENRYLVDDTILAMHNRIDDYEIEKRRTLLEHPDGSVDDLENAIGRLAHRVHKMERRVRAIVDSSGPQDLHGLAG